MLSAQPTLFFTHYWHSYFIRPYWNFQQLPSSWKWYFQVNMWLEKNLQNSGHRWCVSGIWLSTCFWGFGKRHQMSIWPMAYWVSGYGCQVLCHWRKACDAVRSNDFIFLSRKESIRADLHLLKGNLLDFQRKVFKFLIKHWAAILPFLKNRKGACTSPWFNMLGQCFSPYLLGKALQSTNTMHAQEWRALFIRDWSVGVQCSNTEDRLSANLELRN